MAVEVKEEKFGSRPSVLEPFLKENNIHYEKNIFVITCRKEFNGNIFSRYIIFKEFLSEEEMHSDAIKAISNVLKDFMKKRVRGCYVNEEKREIKVLRGDEISTYSYSEFRTLLLKSLDCKFKMSSARGSSQATPLSRFFRENLGKSVSITDMDFFIPASGCFLEEKTFFKQDHKGAKVYLGSGQFYSLKELREDILRPEARILIVHTPEDKGRFFLREFDKGIPADRVYLKGWGSGVYIHLDKVLTSEEFIKVLRG